MEMERSDKSISDSKVGTLGVTETHLKGTSVWGCKSNFEGASLGVL